jgi:hypothetical protein
MFTWVGTVGSSSDPLASTTTYTNLINFAKTNKVTHLYVDIYTYLGGGTYPPSTQETRLHNFLGAAHVAGLKVHALAGNVDWGINQSWVTANVLRNFNTFQGLGSTTLKDPNFDGFCLDVEYWTDANQTAQTSCPALCDLGRSIKKTHGFAVGCFGSFYLKDNTGDRPTISYQGKVAQDGEFLMDNFDYVVVGAYRNHAQDNGTDGPGQISLFQPWYDYASQVGNNYPLYCGSETKQDITYPYTTYYGFTKSAMEAQHTLISNAFTAPTNRVFLGQAIDAYATYNVMPTLEVGSENASTGLLSYLFGSSSMKKGIEDVEFRLNRMTTGQAEKILDASRQNNILELKKELEKLKLEGNPDKEKLNLTETALEESVSQLQIEKEEKVKN